MKILFTDCIIVGSSLKKLTFLLSVVNKGILPRTPQHGIVVEMISKSLRSSMMDYCQRLDQKNWVANHDGNLSVRSSDHFLVTPTARAKRDLVEADFLELDRDGQGKGKVFSEWAVHLRIFRARTDVQAVIHAHPPTSTAVGCANQEMMTWAVPEAVVSLGPGVPLVGLSLPNSEELWTELDPLLPHYDAVMVGGNGVFTWGKDLEQAFLRMELVEHLANILLKSLPLGGPRLLEPQQIANLMKRRVAAGLALPPDPARPHWFPYGFS